MVFPARVANHNPAHERHATCRVDQAEVEPARRPAVVERGGFEDFVLSGREVAKHGAVAPMRLSVKTSQRPSREVLGRSSSPTPNVIRLAAVIGVAQGDLPQVVVGAPHLGRDVEGPVVRAPAEVMNAPEIGRV